MYRDGILAIPSIDRDRTRRAFASVAVPHKAYSSAVLSFPAQCDCDAPGPFLDNRLPANRVSPVYQRARKMLALRCIFDTRLENDPGLPQAETVHLFRLVSLTVFQPHGPFGCSGSHRFITDCCRLRIRALFCTSMTSVG
jgi:hypothetical protein